MFETLQLIQDQRTGNKDCEFNGSVVDFLEQHAPSESIKELLLHLSENMEDTHVMVNYHFDVHHELISNQIIRYKDVQKIPKHSFLLPYLVYAKKAEQVYCLILVEGESVAYIIAKGLFLALSEQGALLENMKNQTIASNSNHPLLLEAWHRFVQGQKAGASQRYLDQSVFSGYEDLMKKLEEMALNLQEDVKVRLKDNHERGLVIYDAVIQWFLFKKVAYVHTMMNRDLLIKQCEGDVKKQRQQAKLNADRIQFLMYSEMWRA
jgi:hypothetical protein